MKTNPLIKAFFSLMLSFSLGNCLIAQSTVPNDIVPFTQAQLDQYECPSVRTEAQCRNGFRGPTGTSGVEGVAISADNSDAPDQSAMLEIKSTTKGFLLPTMSINQRNLIKSPRQGLMVFVDDEDNTKDGIYVYMAATVEYEVMVGNVKRKRTKDVLPSIVNGWFKLKMEFEIPNCGTCNTYEE